MSRLFLYLRQLEFPAWFLQLVMDQLPSVLLSRTLDAIDALAEAKTPALKRALVVTALLEILGAIRISRPMAMVLRFTVLHATFTAAERIPSPSGDVAIARPAC